MAKRRGRGEGSIFQRKDGRWAATVSLALGNEGNRRRRTIYGKTRSDVADKLIELQSARRSGISIDPRKLTLGQYLDDWIKHVATPRVRASTLAEYQRHVARVRDAAGGIALQNWKPSDIRALWAQFQREMIGDRTRRAIHATTHRALGDAVRDGLLRTNPLNAVQSPREKAPSRKTLLPDQVRELLETTKAVESPQTIALVTLIASTGLRIGEALGLRWEDVDLKQGELQVRRNLAELSGRFIEQEPKTAASRRTVTLPRQAVDRLKAHRAAAGTVPLGSGIIFRDSKGSWLRRSNLLRRVWHPLLIEAGLPQVGWHALRHFHATALLAAGEPIADVSARLGHRDPVVTMKIYAHALPDRSRSIADRVEEILG